MTVAVTGWSDGPPVLRSGARPGHLVWVTGPLGRAAAGLRILRETRSTDRLTRRGSPAALGLRTELVAAHARPRPQLAHGAAAQAAGATAMIDVSDGLLADLSHICEESGVGFRLEGVPVAAGATSEEALRGGEDFVLVFCAPESAPLSETFEISARPAAPRDLQRRPVREGHRGQTVDTSGWEHGW